MRIASAASFVLFSALTTSGIAQSPSAALTGYVDDPTKAVIQDVHVTALNQGTGTRAATTTNGRGQFVFPSLAPGTYLIQVDKPGFKSILEPELTLHVQEIVQLNFHMAVGSMSETITVSASGVQLNTSDASVSTVIDGDFIENIPLNGRSIQTLLMLTPGVVFTENANTASQGQFSVNGMRSNSNYFSIDGVAANLGTDEVGNGLPEAAAGSMPGFNAQGGTNSLVSVDAIQEFRVQTSSFAPEFGRTPGAQVAMETRSGTNVWHGSAFDYFRNDVLDANDWFANHDGLPRGKERQNDFGGILGGPIVKRRGFFFFSYEGLRLRQPVVLQGAVPDEAARAAAPDILKPLLAAYPLPNAAEISDNIAGFNASISNPSNLNSYGIRLDTDLGSKVRLFGRFADSPSSSSSAGSPGSVGTSPNDMYSVSESLRTMTLGLNIMPSPSTNDELRLNYSNLRSRGTESLSTLGGAVPPSSTVLTGIYAPGTNIGTAALGFLLGDGSSYYLGNSGISEQRQFNILDNISLVHGLHAVKFGVDYRYLAPFQGAVPYLSQVFFGGINGPGGVLSGQSIETDVQAFSGVSVRTKSFSLYGQDTWKITPQLTLTYGLRWDVNPPPQGNNLANDPLVIEGLDDPSTMTLAPRGTPFYSTRWKGISPRLGIAYKMHGQLSWETFIRGGFGVFYDAGAGSVGSYSLGYPFRAINTFDNTQFPLAPQQAVAPTVDLSGPAGSLTVANLDLVVPRTYQWNLALEQALGPNQALTVTYLGTSGRKLLRDYTLYQPNANFSSVVTVTNNAGASNYQGIQAQFQRQVSHGLDAIISYSYSHSLDNASSDSTNYSPVVLGSPSIDHGNSDFDVRDSASGALSWAIPSSAKQGLLHAASKGWSVQDLVVGRTAFPVDITPYTDTGFLGPYEYSARPNLAPGVPIYLRGEKYPGGKAFNPAAFTDPIPGTEGTLGRNTLRGFGFWQDNFALHRDFEFTERTKLQFRAESFNILNRPAFGDPPGFLPLQSPLFGISEASLANGSSNGSGAGLNSLYQVGAPRSWQFGLKLQF